MNGIMQQKMPGDSNSKEGEFHTLSEKMKESLLAVALKNDLRVTKSHNIALKKQRDQKIEKKKALVNKAITKSTDELANRILLIEMYHQKRWKSKEEVERKFNELGSETAKKEAVKEQIKMRSEGFGWKEECHHPWSIKGRFYDSEELKQHLIEKILPFEELKKASNSIPTSPKVALPTRQLDFRLGTLTSHAEKLDKNKEGIAR